jgi:hypothetical protein
MQVQRMLFAPGIASATAISSRNNHLSALQAPDQLQRENTLTRLPRADAQPSN